MNQLQQNNVYENNLKELQKYDPIFYYEFIKYDFESFQIRNAEIDLALDGTKIMKYNNNGYEWFLNSQYEAIEVAKQWINAKVGKIESIATVMIFGFGNGIYLKELMAKANKSVIFIVYEPSIDIFLTAMSEIDFSFLDERVFFMVEGVNDAKLELYFESLVTYENLSVSKFLNHPNYWSCFHQEGVEYFKRIQFGIKYIQINRNTKIQMGDAYYKNLLMNLRYLDSASTLDQIRDKVGKDIPKYFPAIIVSAGPSLSKNVRQLEKAKGKAFIIATDSSLIGLLEAGIVPDAFTTIDAMKTLNRFQNDRIGSIPVICPESARYEILEGHTAKKIFVNNTFGYGMEFFNKLDIEYKSLNYGGSVATFSFTIARIMGFKTIILVGQDLAFTDNTRYYSQVKEWSDHETLSDKMFIEVEDINGNMVKTSKDLALYLEWFEQQMKEYPLIETIDATEGGAKIHGSKIMTLSLAIKEKCRTAFDMESYIKNLPMRLDTEKQLQMIQLINNIPKQYDTLYNDVKAGIDLYTELLTKLENKHVDSSALINLTKKISELTQKIEKSLVYKHIQHKTRNVEYEVMNNLGVSLEDQIEDAVQVANRGKIMLEAIKQVLEDGVLEEVKHVIRLII